MAQGGMGRAAIQRVGAAGGGRACHGSGGRFADARALAHAIEAAWPGGRAERYVVFTDGEPLLQLDAALLEAVHACGFEAAVETNGTLNTPPGLDWVTVSPKA